MPDTIAHYRVVSKLGEGGMGVVYAADDERLQRRVAIKMVRGTPAQDPQSRERLWREARAAASVSHPNVCQLYEVGEADGELFIAMELLEGEPLSARLARGPIPLTESVDITLAMLSALEAIHARGIVHRDLKPSNIFLTPHGVKLLDFGLARAVTGGQRPDTAPASPWPAPSWARRTTCRPSSSPAIRSTRDRICSPSGAILFELLVGDAAFPGKTTAQVFHGVMYEPLPSVGGSPALAAVDRVIHRATAKTAGRPLSRTPRTMAQELRAALRLGDSGRNADRPQDDAPDRAAVPDAPAGSGDRLPVVQSRRRDHRLARQPRVAGRALEPRGRPVQGRRARPGVRWPPSWMWTRRSPARCSAPATQVRVATQLVEAPGGRLLWSQTTQVTLNDIFQLQDDLTRHIVESLSLPLSAREQRMLSRDAPATARCVRVLPARQRAGVGSQELVDRPRPLRAGAAGGSRAIAPAWARLGRVHAADRQAGRRQQRGPGARGEPRCSARSS